MPEVTGIVLIGLYLFALVLAILWIILPFAIFGVKDILRQNLAVQQTTLKELQSINKNIRTLFREWQEQQNGGEGQARSGLEVRPDDRPPRADR